MDISVKCLALFLLVAATLYTTASAQDCVSGVRWNCKRNLILRRFREKMNAPATRESLDQTTEYEFQGNERREMLDTNIDGLMEDLMKLNKMRRYG